MNKRDTDILLAIASRQFTCQRELAEACGYSLGAVNASVNRLAEAGYIEKILQVTQMGRRFLDSGMPKQAVLLAEGFGMRQPPNYEEIPKPLLQVRGERLIERLICQLQAVGITRICVIVGFAKERFEYLIDQYGVELIVNGEYAKTHTLHSLALAKDMLSRCYVVPCDMWFRENPFRKQEVSSWYMVSQTQDPESTLRVNRKQELVTVSATAPGNGMLGVSFLSEADGAELGRQLEAFDNNYYRSAAWEVALLRGGKFWVAPRVMDSGVATRVNSPTDLRQLNSDAEQIAKKHIKKFLQIQPQGLTVVKNGMTNTSFRFCDRGKDYCIRVPSGEKDKLVDHQREAAVYRVLAQRNLADENIFFDPDSGCKLSDWIPNARACDPREPGEVARCMQTLRQFHEMKLQVDHGFDLFEAILFYEAAWSSGCSMYPDYAQTRENVFSLRQWIDQQEKDLCLSHLDPVPENFLLTEGEEVRLIDWEYAAMHDPHLDIAMFCLQAMYDRRQIDGVIDSYFPEGCSKAVRLKIYSYIAAGGLLWSNWCEYEMGRGTEFGAYSLRQYRYAKEFYRIVENERSNKEEL